MSEAGQERRSGPCSPTARFTLHCRHPAALPRTAAAGHKQTFTPIVSSWIAKQSLQGYAARDGCEAIEFRGSHLLGGLEFIANISAYPLDPLSARCPRLIR